MGAAVDQGQADEILSRALAAEPLTPRAELVGLIQAAGGARRTAYRQVERYFARSGAPPLAERVARMARLLERLLEQYATGARSGSPAALVRAYLELPGTSSIGVAAKLRDADDTVSRHGETQADLTQRLQRIDGLLDAC